MKYIIANWKMNLGMDEVMSWVGDFNTLFSQSTGEKEIVIAPSTIHIPLIDGMNQRGTYKISAQDVSVDEKGAHTGNIGVFQLKDFCTYCIVGHSEKEETKELVYKKRDMCLKNGIVPIVCFVDPENAIKAYKDGVLLTWEDPKNISKGGNYREKDPQEIEKGVKVIRKQIPEGAPLVYGGSVNRQNIQTLARISCLNGVLVGNASLDPQHFLDIILNS